MNKDKEKESFISAKIKKIMDEGKVKDIKQAAAIAYSYWEKLRAKKAALKEIK